jgi:Flp pilus assembly pilin Flp
VTKGTEMTKNYAPQGELMNESGQTMAEYAVVLGVIAIAVVAAMTVLSGQISAALSLVGTKV